jgi:hypothetical protein
MTKLPATGLRRKDNAGCAALLLLTITMCSGVSAQAADAEYTRGASRSRF